MTHIGNFQAAHQFDHNERPGKPICVIERKLCDLSSPSKGQSVTPSELAQLNKAALAEVAVSGDMLTCKTPRTLVKGYTVNRDTFHLYLDEHQALQCVTYDYYGQLVTHTSGALPARACMPDKRANPECCDYDFCGLLLSLNVSIPFTKFDATVPPAVFYGKQLAELTTVPSEHFQLAPPPFLLEELGVPIAQLDQLSLDMRSKLDARLVETMRSHFAGCLRTLLLRKDEIHALKWLDNLPAALEHDIRNAAAESFPHGQLIEESGLAGLADLYTMSPKATTLVIERCYEVLAKHLASLGVEMPSMKQVNGEATH